MVFRIEGLPPSYNKHFQIIWGLKECHLSPEAHAYKNRVKMSMPPITLDPNDTIQLKIDYYYNWYYKNNNLRKIDTANCDKLLIDAICERCGIDDSRVKQRIVIDHPNTQEEYVIVEIDKCPNLEHITEKSYSNLKFQKETG